jgi:hypothetical protein
VTNVSLCAMAQASAAAPFKEAMNADARAAAESTPRRPRRATRPSLSHSPPGATELSMTPSTGGRRGKARRAFAPSQGSCRGARGQHEHRVACAARAARRRAARVPTRTRSHSQRDPGKRRLLSRNGRRRPTPSASSQPGGGLRALPSSSTSSRTRLARPLGRPPGFPDCPGWTDGASRCRGPLPNPARRPGHLLAAHPGVTPFPLMCSSPGSVGSGF